MAKIKYPLEIAEAAASRIIDLLGPYCAKIQVAGSIRRRKAQVGDIEIVYIPMYGTRQVRGELFSKEVSLLDQRLEELLEMKRLGKRLKVNAMTSYGSKIKLMVDLESGIPLDLFATTESCWWNLLVVRTGGAENNTMIAAEAKRMGWKWAMGANGFFLKAHPSQVYQVKSEEDVYRFVGLPYLEPEDRV